MALCCVALFCMTSHGQHGAWHGAWYGLTCTTPFLKGWSLCSGKRPISSPFLGLVDASDIAMTTTSIACREQRDRCAEAESDQIQVMRRGLRNVGACMMFECVRECVVCGMCGVCVRV